MKVLEKNLDIFMMFLENVIGLVYRYSYVYVNMVVFFFLLDCMFFFLEMKKMFLRFIGMGNWFFF